MLEALALLGEIFGKNTLWDDFKADYILLLEIDRGGNLKGVSYEEFTSEKLEKYLYKESGTSKPPSWTPTLALNKGEPVKSLRLLNERLKELLGIELKGDLNEIAQLIKEKLKELPQKAKVFLTVKIDGKYIGEIPDAVENLKEYLRGRFQERATDGVCSLCLKHTKVSGTDNFPFKFYTLDKPGFIHGGFKNKAYVFPLCWDCIQKVKEGGKFVRDNLQFQFTKGVRFYLIPELVKEDKETLKKLVEKILKEEARSDEGLTSKRDDRLTASERKIFNRLSREGNYFYVHLLFVTKPTRNVDRIELYLQGIYPSRLKELFECKRKVEKLLNRSEEKESNLERDGEKEDAQKGKVVFNYSTAREFLKDNDTFYGYIYSTFRGVEFDKNTLLGSFLERLRTIAVEVEKGKPLSELTFAVKRALAVYLFELCTRGGLNMNTEAKTLEEFLNRFPHLKGDFEKGVFLLGVLTQTLLEKQYKERESKPFLKKLKGFKLHLEDFKELYTELRAKFEEYDLWGKKIALLFEEAAKYLLSSPEKPKVSQREANFIFASGMGLKREVFDLLKEEEKEEVAQNG